ncbi:MAG: metal-dependent transcriptional regulator [Sedimentisphaerales bacterium]|nr:metal-dependent transcriptional regulator [Sedimentisphaerales bacterium]
MAAATTSSLSASLEDYLAVIFWIAAGKGAARVKDVAKRLQVKAASVTGAFQTLAEKQYVNYRPYEPVTLTREGFERAARVVQRHHALRQFLTETLGIDEASAENAACRLEHDIPSPIAQRLVAFNEYVKNLPEREQSLIAAFSQDDATTADESISVALAPTTVADLNIGTEAVIAGLRGNSRVARRLADMGLGRGALVMVESVAPMGDPIRVKIRGYRLALRKQEAKGIVVIER